MDLLGEGLMILMECVANMDLAKQMSKKKDCSSFAIKRCCVWQTHSLKRSSEKYYTAWVNMKQINFVMVSKSNGKR